MAIKTCKCGSSTIDFKLMKDSDLTDFEDNCCAEMKSEEPKAPEQPNPEETPADDSAAESEGEQTGKSKRGRKPKAAPVTE